MTTKFEVSEPGKVEFTLSITMTLREWKELQGQLARDWPAWKLGAVINGMVSQATMVFQPKPEAPESRESPPQAGG